MALFRGSFLSPSEARPWLLEIEDVRGLDAIHAPTDGAGFSKTTSDEM